VKARRSLHALAVVTLLATPAAAQQVSYRGFLDGRVTIFPQDAVNDTVNTVGDGLARLEVSAAPVDWLRLAAGVDARANSHDQVEDAWRLDFSDRGALRPRLSVRRLVATLHRGPLTADVGKQFIRWGKADVVTPTDRFAPRDFLNVIDADFLAVRGARAVYEAGAHTFDVVWVPVFTPSRVPLLNQRWTPVPPGVTLELVESTFPDRSQVGVRWGHTAGGFESSLSFYDGVNHLPTVEQPDISVALLPPAGSFVLPVKRLYERMRMWGGDAAIPTRWFTIKGEAGYFTSPDQTADEYVLYVVQLERQTGEWLLIGGYVGEVVTEDRPSVTFAPDRGLAKTIVGRASYTIDVNRSMAIEGSVRQNGDGLYVKGEYSQARGQHWRATFSAALIRGEPGDFLGQYRLNSNIGLALRYSF
jgi:hypothetical protein